MFQLGFPTGRDSAAFWDKGTEVPSLSRNGQWDKLKILPRDGPGPDFDILPWDGPGRNFDSLSHPIPVQDAGEKGKKSTKTSLSQDFCSCNCPGTKGQWDVPSLGNPSFNQSKHCYVFTVVTSVTSSFLQTGVHVKEEV